MKKILILALALGVVGCSNQPATDDPGVNGRNLIVLRGPDYGGSTYRYCDGHSGRMIFENKRMDSGGMFVLENQEECK